MGRRLLATAVLAVVATTAPAWPITLFDGAFLTAPRDGAIGYAEGEDGVAFRIEDTRYDVGDQRDQIRNSVASGVAAIVVNPADTEATVATSQAAGDGAPLVHVHRQPATVDEPPDDQAFVASEKVSGTFRTLEIRRPLKAAGETEAKALVPMGEPSSPASRMHAQDSEDVIGAPDRGFVTIVEEQTTNVARAVGADLMTGAAGRGRFDAVTANDDVAIQAPKSAGVSMCDVMVGGVDATQDALAAGERDVTAFQNVAGPDQAALHAALNRAPFARLDVARDPDAQVSDRTVAHKQMVEIARAFSSDSGGLVMDEPTSVLTDREVAHRIAIIPDLEAEGIAIVRIPHKVNGPLGARGLTPPGVVHDVSFHVRRGETLGLDRFADIRSALIARDHMRGGFVDEGAVGRIAADMAARLRVKTPNLHEIVENLSGGDRQTRLNARWLLTRPRILILDEPTRWA